MNEKLLEKKLREGVKVKGGIALKLTSISLTGLPDRLVLLPGGRVKFAELKSTGKKQTRLQVIVSDKLRALGFEVWVIDTQDTLNEFLKTC